MVVFSLNIIDAVMVVAGTPFFAQAHLVDLS